MNYREVEREKVIRIRDSFFKDPGKGLHQGVDYPFVLTDAKKIYGLKFERMQ